MREKLIKTLKGLRLYHISRAGRDVFLKLRNIIVNYISRMYYLFFPSAYILVYHRVANVTNDPHLLCVSPDHFYRQIKFLKENFSIISLNELVDNLKKRKIKKNSVVITFDDGYLDNLTNALPILEKFNVPVTIFISSGRINSMDCCHWDIVVPQEDRGKNLMNEDLGKLAASPLVEIGAHTVNHERLSQLSEEEQRFEINESKRQIERIINKPIKCFSYPFGARRDINDNSVPLVIETGYEYACATMQRRVTSRTNRFLLPRLLIRDWEINEFIKKIRKF